MTSPKSADKERRIGHLSRTVAVAVIAGVLLVSLLLIRPAMPDRIVLLTGPEGSSYQALGQRYAAILRGRGLETDVVITQGGLDNLQRLAAGQNNAVAIAPSSVDHAADVTVDTSHLEALGSVGFEPIWLFYQSDLDVQRIGDLAGLEVATGGPGTVTEMVARALFELNDVNHEVVIAPAKDQTPESVADALLKGTIDAAFAMGDPASPNIHRMLEADSVSFLSFTRAAAYAAQVPGVTTLTVPEGVFDFERNNPPEDAHLISVTTNLVASESLHPAVVPLVLSAAGQVLQSTTFFSTKAVFPSDQYVTLPLKPAAKRFFEKGETGLSKHLPYRVTRSLNHLGLVVLPLLTLAFVLIKAVPMALDIWMKLKLTGLYKQLEIVEKSDAVGGDRSELLAQLEEIDRASSSLFVPRSKLLDYIDFRQFLHDMRERVEKA